MTPQELKNSILQLAIQGKLVEQRPEEGTAEELYQQIQEEKRRLIKEKKIKKQKPPLEIAEDEEPFEIPESWKWVRLGNTLNTLVDGTHRTPKYTSSGIPFISVRNMSTGTLDISDSKYISREEHAELSKRCNPEKGDILLSKIGTTGVPAKVDTDEAFSLFVSVALLKFNLSMLDRDFLVYMLLTPNVQKQCKEHTRGVGNKNWVINDIANTMFPLPPLAEQKRIVAKVEEILPYIDRYEQAWIHLENFNKRFPMDMQKSLLQLAIQGKLVEQRPDEGTAEDLYQQIQAEKRRLIKEKKLKKEKPLPEIAEDEIPFEIPDSWKWVQLGTLLHFIDTGKSIRCNEVPPDDGQCGIIKVSAVTWGTFNENESKTCYSNDSWVEQYAIHLNDFLICRANTAALVGGCVIVDQVTKKLMLSDKVLRLHFSKIEPFYLLWALRTPLARNQFSAAATGTSDSMKNISQDAIRSLLIPLPPLAEQKRIVAKLDELLPLCGKLKAP